MEIKPVIGFGGVFYTLWSVSSQINYYTAPNGQHYPSYTEYHYSYIQNIAKDIEKVKTLYPGVAIDMELHGSKSFTIEKKDIDLTPEILKFGKYAGWNINDLAKHDFNYLVKMVDECFGSFEVRQLAKETPEYI
jgi:hypothetical protein